MCTYFAWNQLRILKTVEHAKQFKHSSSSYSMDVCISHACFVQSQLTYEKKETEGE
jgi:hypothetical protein